MGGAVGDGDVFRFGLQHGFESVHCNATDILQGDVEVDGLAKIKLSVFILVVDDLVVEDDVRTVCRDDTHDGFIAQVVLTGHNEVDFGWGHLGLKLDGLWVASGFGDGEDFPTAFRIGLYQADDAAFRGGDAHFSQTSEYHFRMNDFHFLRHLRVDAQEGIAVGGEHGIGDVLAFRVVRPVALGEEILAGHVTKSGHPVTCVGRVWTVGGHEVAVEEVVNTPNVGVVNERIGNLGRTEHADGTCILTIEGTTHPFLSEAVAS